MRDFHLGCPYTSLPVCHCQLHVPAPPARAEIRKPARATGENSLRRALLLEMVESLTPAAGAAQAPPGRLTHHLFHRAAHGRAPPSRMRRSAPALEAVMRAAEGDADERLAEAEERAARARERAQRAAEDLAKAEAAHEAERQGAERGEEMLHDQFVERRAGEPRTPESESADELFAKRRAAAKRRSKARARQRR